MKEINTPVIQITQPIGTFYLGRVKASDLRDAVWIKRKSENSLGVQRDLISGRLKEIQAYCEDVDATFPTSIILSIDTSLEDVSVDITETELHLKFANYFGSVIDGQHRLKGILLSDKADEFYLPVVFMLNPTAEDEAYIFSIINSTQRKVNPSLIYDLFDVMSKRSPKKTVHDIARAFNGRENSPFYNRLKMLGKKTPDQAGATLSQGTFGKRILNLITGNADEDARLIKKDKKLSDDDIYIFRKYFINDKDDVIMKILLNCFQALRKVFYEEWDNPHNNILWKTTGFNAVVDSLPEIYKFGTSRKDLTEGFFHQIFNKFKVTLEEKGMLLTSEYFGSGESETKKMKNLILEAVRLMQSSEELGKQ